MIRNPAALRLFLQIYMFVLGSVVGSFLNVCIARLPEGKSLVWPGSHCPKCDFPIRWFDNIPVISFILLRGKCRNCGGSISWQYPLVELLTACLFVLLMQKFTNVLALVIYIIFTCCLVIITFVDFKHYIIPNEISIPGILVGLALSFVPARLAGGQLVLTRLAGSPLLSSLLIRSLIGPEYLAKYNHVIQFLTPFLDSLVGCITGAGLLYLAGWFSVLVFKKEGMGFGDVKLLAMVGAFLGWKLALMTIMVGSLMGAGVGLTLILLKLKTRADYIPFGPYLALGSFLSLMWGERLLSLYLGFGIGLNELILRLSGSMGILR